MKRDFTNEEIEAIKADIDRHLPIREIAKKYHISFSVYSQIRIKPRARLSTKKQ